MHPPVFKPTASTAYQYHRSNPSQGQPSNHHHHNPHHQVNQTPRVVLPQDVVAGINNGDQNKEGGLEKKNEYVALELPQDAKPKIMRNNASGSESENNDSDSDGDNGLVFLLFY